MLRLSICAAVLAGGISSVPALAQYPAPIPISTAPPPLTTPQALREMAAAHPLCMVIGEGFAGNWVNKQTLNEGPFSDFVMGARVQGTQKTSAKTTIDFLPQRSAAKLAILLNGMTSSQTLAQTPQAMVQSAGNYQFLVSKQIEFNGETFRTWSPSAFLTINQRNLNAATPVSNIPLLGPLASNVALGVAEQRRPLTDLVTAQRITQTVAPEFNSRLDAELSRLNDRLANSVRPLLASKQLTPSNVATSSTDDALLLAVSFDPETAPAAARGRVYPLSSSADPGKSKDRFQVPMQLLSSTPGDGFVPRSGPSGSGTPPTASVARDASQLLIHESLVASLAARFGLAGKEVPDGALQKLLLPGASTESGPPTAQMGTILLSPDRPLSATFANGEIILEVRVGFRPVVGPELPQQTIAVAIVPKLTDASIEFTPTLRSITPVNPGPEGALGPMAEGIIRQAIEQRMKTASVPRSFTAPRDGDQPGIPLRVAQLTVTEGWIRAALEVAPAGSVPSGSEQTWQTPAPRAASIPAK